MVILLKRAPNGKFVSVCHHVLEGELPMTATAYDTADLSALIDVKSRWPARPVIGIRSLPALCMHHRFSFCGTADASGR